MDIDSHILETSQPDHITEFTPTHFHQAIGTIGICHAILCAESVIDLTLSSINLTPDPDSRAALSKNRIKNNVKAATIRSAKLFLAQLTENSNIQLDLMDESYDLIDELVVVCLEFMMTSSLRLTSHHDIGTSMALTHMTKIIMIDMYAIKITGLNMRLSILPIEMSLRNPILEFSILELSITLVKIIIINGENIIVIRRKNILKKLMITKPNIAIEYISIIIKFNQNSINRFRLSLVSGFGIE